MSLCGGMHAAGPTFDVDSVLTNDFFVTIEGLEELEDLLSVTLRFHKGNIYPGISRLQVNDFDFYEIKTEEYESVPTNYIVANQAHDVFWDPAQECFVIERLRLGAIQAPEVYTNVIESDFVLPSCVLTGDADAYVATLPMVETLTHMLLFTAEAHLDNLAECTMVINGSEPLDVYTQEWNYLEAGTLYEEMLYNFAYHEDGYVILMGPAKPSRSGIDADEPLEIVSGSCNLNMRGGPYFYYDNTEGHTLYLFNPPVESTGQSIAKTFFVTITNAGAFPIIFGGTNGVDDIEFLKPEDTTFEFTEDGEDTLIITYYARNNTAKVDVRYNWVAV